MTRQVKGPGTDALKREYVYADPEISYAKLAEKHGLSVSNVSGKATRGHWVEERERYRRKLAEETRNALGEKWAEMQVAIYERSAKLALKYFDLYESALDSGDIRPSTRDMLGVAAMMRTFTTDMARPVGELVDPSTGDVFDGTAEEARVAIEKIRALMSGEPDGE